MLTEISLYFHIKKYYYIRFKITGFLKNKKETADDPNDENHNGFYETDVHE